MIQPAAPVAPAAPAVDAPAAPPAVDAPAAPAAVRVCVLLVGVDLYSAGHSTLSSLDMSIDRGSWIDDFPTFGPLLT